MPILSSSPCPPTTVLCVRELRVPIPTERHRDVETFYTQVLGLSAWPEARQIPGGWGAGDPRRGVYFQFCHDLRTEPMRRRLVLTVGSLDSLALRLSGRQWPFARWHGLDHGDQGVLLHDPVGHRIEIRQVRPL